MKIQPLFDRVVIKQQQAETVTKSGLILSDNQEKPQIATVLSVGPGGMIDGKEIVMQVKTGDKVLYPKYAGSQFKIDGEELTVLRQSDILAIIKD